MTAQLTNMIKNSTITNSGSDTKFFPESQISAKFKTSNTAMLWQYGVGGVAPVDSFGVTLAIGGDEGNRVTIAHAPHLRPKGLKAGEVYIGNLITKSIITFKSDGSIDVVANGDVNVTSTGTVNVNAQAVNITAPTINLVGNVVVTGNITGSGTFAMGGGGAIPIARLGDSVAGGVITSASANSSTT